MNSTALKVSQPDNPVDAMARAPVDSEMDVEVLRRVAFQVDAEGRKKDARRLLEAAIEVSTRLGRQPNCEMIGDLAALAAQDGEVLQAITLSRQALALQPEHDASQFTLALCLARVGSYAEALRLHEGLADGERGERFERTMPGLAAMTRSEIERLKTISATPTVCGLAVKATH